MRPSLPASLVLLLAAGCTASRAQAPAEPPPQSFTMRTYYLALLRRGPAWTKERTPEALADGKGHMDNIQRLGRCGKLLIAGPFQVGPEASSDALAGLFLFDVPTLEEAVALTQTDPAVRSGRFTVEVVPWFGPAGLTYDGRVPVDPSVRCEP